jgi:hypothetical protein
MSETNESIQININKITKLIKKLNSRDLAKESDEFS